MGKVNITISIIILLYLSAPAQPIFTSAQWPFAGSIFVSHELDTNGVSEGPAGMNVTWDFSNAASIGSSTTSSIVSPSSTPYAAQFPTSNAAEINQSWFSGNPIYNYFEVSANSVTQIGQVEYDSANSVAISFGYSNSRRIYNLPFSFQSTSSDSYSAFASYVVGANTWNIYRRGDNEVTGDAYGSITTPGGNYPQALRIKQTYHRQDSINDNGLMIITGEEVISYSWWSANSIAPIMEVSFRTDEDSSGNLVGVKSARYMDIITGVKEIQALKPLEVFPNPAMSRSLVHFSSDELSSGPTTFIAVDAMGREVKRIYFSLHDATRKTVEIDMSDCVNGIYNVRLEQRYSVFTARFIKN